MSKHVLNIINAISVITFYPVLHFRGVTLLPQGASKEMLLEWLHECRYVLVSNSIRVFEVFEFWIYKR